MSNNSKIYGTKINGDNNSNNTTNNNKIDNSITKNNNVNNKYIQICDFYFMRTINNELSTNKFFNKLDTTKERFIMIFSDILYGIEKGQLLSFKSIQYRILTICLMIQGLPEKNIDKIYNKGFESFIEDYFIKESHAIQYIKNIYKWYEIDDIKYINPYTLNREMRYATASIILNS